MCSTLVLISAKSGQKDIVGVWSDSW